ncbi:MAG: TonB-dependent receptor [Saprospiraceae bacterium]|nr:TonB-dependent receptor [Saprospiraceae bacterium]
MKKTTNLQRLTFLGLLFIVKPLFSQNNATSSVPDSLISLDLNEVIFTGKKLKSNVFNTAESISILHSKALSLNSQRNTPELLNEAPGVFLQKTNHGGGSAFLRGLTGNQVLYLIDGIRINNAITRYGPNQYLNTIDRFSLERIEIVRGSGSVLFGSDAIGGVINMLSINPDVNQQKALSGKISTRIGSNHLEESLNGRISYKNKESWLTSGITTRSFGDLIGGKNTKLQHPSGYDEFCYDVKTNIQINKRHTIQGLLQYVHQKDVPVYHKYILENFALNKMDPQKRSLAYVGYTYTPEKGFIQNIKFTPNIQQVAESRWSKKNNSNLTTIENDTVEIFGVLTELNTLKNIGDWKWSGSHGFDLYHDKVNSNRIQMYDNNTPIFKRGLYPDDATQISYAFFTNQHIEKNKFQVTLGNRIQFLSLQIPIDNGQIINIQPKAWVGNFYVAQSILPKLKLIYGLNTGFRAPNIDDLGSLGIVDFRYEIPNYELRPEKSAQIQIGYKWNGPKFNWETYTYYNRLKDIVVRNKKGNETIDGYPVYIKENAENGYIMGLETNFQYILGRSLQLTGSLTYTYGQNTSKKEPIRRIPPLFGYVNIQYQKEKYWAKLFFQLAGKQQRLAAGDISDNRIGRLGTPGWSVINISNGFNFKKIDINLTLQNVLDKDYKFHGSGINGVGRSLILEFSWSI